MVSYHDICGHDKLCTGCHACENICKLNAIEMEYDVEGFLYPKIDNRKCVDCGLCKTVCPVSNKKEMKSAYIPNGYAAWHRDDTKRMKGSSGGAFGAFAEYIINNNGVVFGAAFDKNYHVSHIMVDCLADLDNLYGSKYVQSELGDIFKIVKKCLIEKRMVLFSGTPCQVAGLQSYLKEEYDNLYTVDIICHGVPAPRIWDRFVEEKKNEYSSEIEKISFRDKRDGWKEFGTSIRFVDGREYYVPHYWETYMKGFLLNMFLRPSCSNCQFKTTKRNCDITLADFWGIENTNPELFNDKGVSLVICQSEKGRELLNNASDIMECVEIELSKALEYNQAIVKSSDPYFARKRFFAGMSKSKMIDKWIEICIKPKLMRRIINKIMRMVRIVK